MADKKDDPIKIGVNVPIENMLLIAFCGLMTYGVLANFVYVLLTRHVLHHAPTGKLGMTFITLYSLIWFAFWLLGWQHPKKEKIDLSSFGTVWIAGWFTGLLLPAGPYWSLPRWIMRVKPLPAVVITTKYEEVDVQPKGHSIDADGKPASEEDSSTKKKGNGIKGSIVKLKMKVTFQWFVHPRFVRRLLAKIAAEWSKNIDWSISEKVLDQAFSPEVLSEVRSNAAKLNYQNVFDNHLTEEIEVTDEDSGSGTATKTIKRNECIVETLRKNDVLKRIGVLAYRVTVQKVEAGSENIEKALSGEAIEEGELAKQKRDAQTFHELKQYHHDQLVKTGRFSKNASNTWDEAMRLALLTTGKMEPVQPIELTGNRSGQANVQVHVDKKKKNKEG